MIRSTFSGLEIAKTGLFISQRGLDVTGHNIANVDTPGYTRQRLITSSISPYNGATLMRPIGRGAVGRGTEVMVLQQIRSSFLDRQFRTEQTLLTDWQTKVQNLTYMQSLFEGSEDASIDRAINDLFTAFNAGATEGNDLGQRNAIKNAALNLTETMRQIYDRLIELQDMQTKALEIKVNDMNQMLDQLAVLNRSIYNYEMTGEPANELRDQRNLLLDDLSSYVDIRYEEKADNTFTLSIAGQEVVNHTTVNGSFSLTVDATTQKAHIDFNSPTGTLLKCIYADEIGGAMKAHLELRDGDGKNGDYMGVQYFINKLDTMAEALFTYVNAQHQAGYTLVDDGSGTSEKGGDFFEFDGERNAGNLKLNQDIIDNPNYIALSDQLVNLNSPPGTNGDDSDMQRGNQENGRNIYALFTLNSIPDSLKTIADQYVSDYNSAFDPLTESDKMISVPKDPDFMGNFRTFMDSIIQDVSVVLHYANLNSDNQLTQALSVDEQRMAMSGVSIDEEMTNLIKYQHAYSGSARVITAMDEALDLIINRMGLVGRS